MSDHNSSPRFEAPNDPAYGGAFPGNNTGFGPGGAVPPPGLPGYPQQPGYPLPGFEPSANPYASFPTTTSNSAYSIVSFVLGIVSIFMCFFGVITGVIGVIFGIIGIRQANADPTRVGGKGLAIAGIVLSLLSAIGWPVLFVLMD